jgi:hypothetical protein
MNEVKIMIITMILTLKEKYVIKYVPLLAQ